MDMKANPLSLLKDASLLKSQAFLNGQWIDADHKFSVTDPATGAELGKAANCSAKQAEQAIKDANLAWPAWRETQAKARANVLRRWYELLMANMDDLARLMTAENGKPLAESRGEVAYGASFVEWFAEEAKRINGETLPTFDNNRRLLVLRQAIGVCAAITPWTFPLASAAATWGFSRSESKHSRTSRPSKGISSQSTRGLEGASCPWAS